MRSKPKKKTKPAARGTKVQLGATRKEIRLDDIKAIVDRAKSALSPEDHATLESVVDTLAYVTSELEAKGASIRRLRKLLFGASTEKTRKLFGDDELNEASDPKDSAPPDPSDGSGDTPPPGDGQDEPAEPAQPPRKRKGHGRNGARKYKGAKKERVRHPALRHGDPCPNCERGKVYVLAEPGVLIRIRGVAPLDATVYELERLRCNLCGMVFTADAPAGVGSDKYDETAASMVALLKYGAGVPFYRIERLESTLGIPLPASTQWDLVASAAELLDALYEELLRQAANGQVLHNDDTTMRILEIDRESASRAAAAPDANPARTGVFTSGIVATTDSHRIALFFTGCRHAGENLSRLLALRTAGVGPPIHMSDALSHNRPGDFDVIWANCLTHARRNFVDVVDDFPEECQHVIEVFREVYRNDAIAREQKLPPDQRLAYHQEHSAPQMAALRTWFDEQFEARTIEPNSALGDAIRYMTKRWDKLTQFLTIPGAPLDNNLCERALKKAVLHRKNAMFYRTENGAKVGDLFMSLIHTAELCHANPFDYLTALQRNHHRAAAAPAEWMPWNYTEALARASTPDAAH